MSKEVASQPKTFVDSEVVYESKWVTVHLDHYLSNGGQTLEYPLATRSDSVIILAMQAGKFVLGDAQMRPGVKERTLDFPGGRVDDKDPRAAAEQTVRREFQLDDSVALELEPLTKRPLFVDSAFSSQKVHGFVVDIPGDVPLEGTRYSADELTNELQCMQCRAMLLEWMYRNKDGIR